MRRAMSSSGRNIFQILVGQPCENPFKKSVNCFLTDWLNLKSTYASTNCRLWTGKEKVKVEASDYALHLKFYSEKHVKIKTQYFIGFFTSDKLSIIQYEGASWVTLIPLQLQIILIIIIVIIIYLLHLVTGISFPPGTISWPLAYEVTNKYNVLQWSTAMLLIGGLASCRTETHCEIQVQQLQNVVIFIEDVLQAPSLESTNK